VVVTPVYLLIFSTQRWGTVEGAHCGQKKGREGRSSGRSFLHARAVLDNKGKHGGVRVWIVGHMDGKGMEEALGDFDGWERGDQKGTQGAKIPKKPSTRRRQPRYIMDVI